MQLGNQHKEGGDSRSYLEKDVHLGVWSSKDSRHPTARPGFDVPGDEAAIAGWAGRVRPPVGCVRGFPEKPHLPVAMLCRRSHVES